MTLLSEDASAAISGTVGIRVGSGVGKRVGSGVGKRVGCWVGFDLGSGDGDKLGFAVRSVKSPQLTILKPPERANLKA